MEHAAGAPDGHDAAEPVEAAACDVSPGNRPAADDISLESRWVAAATSTQGTVRKRGLIWVVEQRLPSGMGAGEVTEVGIDESRIQNKSMN